MSRAFVYSLLIVTLLRPTAARAMDELCAGMFLCFGTAVICSLPPIRRWTEKRERHRIDRQRLNELDGLELARLQFRLEALDGMMRGLNPEYVPSPLVDRIRPTTVMNALPRIIFDFWEMERRFIEANTKVLRLKGDWADNYIRQVQIQKDFFRGSRVTFDRLNRLYTALLCQLRIAEYKAACRVHLRDIVSVSKMTEDASPRELSRADQFAVRDLGLPEGFYEKHGKEFYGRLAIAHRMYRSLKSNPRLPKGFVEQVDHLGRIPLSLIENYLANIQAFLDSL